MSGKAGVGLSSMGKLGPIVSELRPKDSCRGLISYVASARSVRGFANGTNCRIN